MIRRAHPSEAAAISALILDLAPFMTIAPDGAGAEEFLASLGPTPVGLLLADPEFRYFSAWIGTQLAGVVALRGPAHLYHLFVARPWHGQGLGRRLWDFARAELGAQQSITVNASAHAHGFYRRLGFADSGPRTEVRGIAFIPMLLRQ
ncbi:GNAT family N-acetyltransferase [Massilia sp. TS11]|uniref:GNAT family N-acetyltransferase n=1 Tax=Massilia sp. TS11 TaxID=2908003 RepID=UPI001EDA4ED3|nr:GNAT family N-acetyltransferase [Massilia sp. TS11]MCG2585303.1 GNAT family N-acetyltransferase [Massilia sp. TS11]